MTHKWLPVNFFPGGKTAQTTDDIRVKVARHEYIVIPKGFITDFATVPWVFRRLVPQIGGAHIRAAVLHDFICSDAKRAAAKNDKIMLRVMEQDGVNKAVRLAMYAALRVGSYIGLRSKSGARRPWRFPWLD